MLGDLPERLVPFELPKTSERFQGKNSIYRILQKLPLKPWKSLACLVIEITRA